MTKVTLHLSDINDFTADYNGQLFDAVLTDSPYELAFMNKSWDKSGVSFNKKTWAGILNLLRSGANLLSFGGTRTYHRIAVAIEDAGFQIRDCIGYAWVYGSGFPKSYNLSKGIDARLGSEPEIIGIRSDGRGKWEAKLERTKGDTGVGHADGSHQTYLETAPSSPEAKLWQGFGTALKPAWEPIVLAMKPIDGTFVNNALKHGVAGINIDGTRIKHTEPIRMMNTQKGGDRVYKQAGRKSETTELKANGRWPTNIILDEEAGKLMDEQSGQLTSGTGAVKKASAYGGKQSRAYGRESRPEGTTMVEYGDTGGSSRFFKMCTSDKLCLLCFTPKHSIMNAWKYTLAHSAEKNGWNTQATRGFIVRANAMGIQNERLVQNVKSAGNLCDTCAMSIAVTLVGIKTSAFSEGELQVILDCIEGCNNSILIQSLALFAELWESIDIIPTTKNLLRLFGYVRHVTESYTKLEKEEVVEEGNGLEMATRFRYISKSSKKDKDAGVIAAPDGHPRNNHSTVKPIELTKYLATQILPPYTGRPRRLLVPFCGSGSEIIGAVLAGWDEVVGVDITDISIAGQRVHWWQKMMQQLRTNDIQKILAYSFPQDYEEKAQSPLSELPIFGRINETKE